MEILVVHKVVLYLMLVIIIKIASKHNKIIIIEAAPENALITKLPGFNGTFPSKHYSGYIRIKNGSNKSNESPPKNLFYYFVESERNPMKDPLVLWLNGGPGCSSFDGFVYEHGPFNFQAGETNTSLPMLHLNPYSWSKVSNIIYLDSPVGVGLSYSENQTAYHTGDQQTAIDTQTFLLKWLEEYSEFRQNPFYIAGESYAGVYVPTLAAQIVSGLQAKVNPTINFKGYMIGNGVTDKKYDGNALVPFAHGMALISDDLYNKFTTACGLDYVDNEEKECTTYGSRIDEALDGLNLYDILEPCYHKPETNKSEEEKNMSSLPSSFKLLGKTERPLPVRKRMFGRAWPYNFFVQEGPVPSWPQLNAALPHDRRLSVACTDDEVASAWLNDEAVRQAIHAEPESVTGAWSLCVSIDYHYDAGSIIDIHTNLTSQGFRVLIYSGDHDMCVPYTGTQAWTSSLGYQIVDEWRPWKSSIDQVAGFLQGYEHNLTFLTIKGAGHTVPEYKPRESLDFYSRWLEGKPI